MRRVVISVIAWLVVATGTIAESGAWKFVEEPSQFDGYPTATIDDGKGSALMLLAFECGVWGMVLTPSKGRVPPDLFTQPIKFAMSKDHSQKWIIFDWKFSELEAIQIKVDESTPVGKKWIDDIAGANQSIQLAVTGEAGTFEASFSAVGSSAAIQAARRSQCSESSAVSSPDALGPPSGDIWKRPTLSNGDTYLSVSVDGAEVALFCTSPGQYRLSYAFPESDLATAIRGKKVSLGLADALGKIRWMGEQAPGLDDGLATFGGDIREGDETWGLLKYSDGDIAIFLKEFSSEKRLNSLKVPTDGASELMSAYAEECSRS